MSPHSDEVRRLLLRTQGIGLRTVNGIGTALLGAYWDKEFAGTYYAMVWFTVLFVPVVPLGIFLVGPGIDATSGKPNGLIRFYGRMPVADFQRLYPGGLARLLGATVVHSLLFLAAAVIAIVVAYLIVGAMRHR
jgi:hypothetical protein